MVNGLDAGPCPASPRKPERGRRRPSHGPRLVKGFTSQPACYRAPLSGACWWWLALDGRRGTGRGPASPLPMASPAPDGAATAAALHRAALSFPSGNGKTGPIAVSSTSRSTCPASCSLAGEGGCYAEASFRTRLHWNRLSDGRTGQLVAAFIAKVRTLPAGVLFRHCVAGDQWPDAADPLRIDRALLLQLARASRHLRAAWSYSHYPMDAANRETLLLAAAAGLVVNASTESRSTAAQLQHCGIPSVCVVPAGTPAVFEHEGVRFVQCPHSRSGGRIQCISCGGRFGLPLCAIADRSFVITFPAHGARALAATSRCS